LGGEEPYPRGKGTNFPTGLFENGFVGRWGSYLWRRGGYGRKSLCAARASVMDMYEGGTEEEDTAGKLKSDFILPNAP